MTTPFPLLLCFTKSMRIFFTLAAGWCTALAQGMTLTPIEMDFSPAGRGATQMFRLENNTNEPVAVELVMKSRTMSIQGNDVLDDAEDQFNIYPAQLVLQPGQLQSVRVQYTGTATPDKELAFRLIAEQLPIDLGQPAQEGGRMRLLVKYIASVYVVPRNARAVLSVTEARIVQEGSQQWLQVRVQNDGATRKILKNTKLIFGALTLSGQALQGLEGENILARTARIFRLKMPAEGVSVDVSPRLVLD